MPYKSAAQRRWMHRNRPDIAKNWDKKYGTAIDMNCGGYVEPAQSFVDGGYVASSTVNMVDGGVVYRTDGGDSFNIADYRKSLKMMDEADFWELAANSKIPLEFRNGKKKPRDQMEYEMGVKLYNEHNDPRAILEWIPIVGDVLMADELVEAIKNKQWVLAAILGGATVIGFVPGIGDAVAMGIKKVAKAIAKVPSSVKSMFIKTATEIPTEFLLNNADEFAGVITQVASKPAAQQETAAAELLTNFYNRAREAGYDVQFGKHPTAGYATDHANRVIHIPAGLDKRSVLTALEEYHHALSKEAGYLGDAQKLLREAIAKSKAIISAKNAGIDITPADLKDFADGYYSYLTQVFNNPNLLDSLPKPSSKLWEWMGITPIDKTLLKQGDRGAWQSLYDDIAEYYPNWVASDTPMGQQLSTNAAKLAVARKWYIRVPGKEVEELEMTVEAFRELTGIGESAVKKQGGRIKGNQAFPEGTQWSKDPEGFKDFKTGQTKGKVEFDKGRPAFKEKGDKAVRLPSSLSSAVSKAIRKGTDEATLPHFERITKRYDDDIDFDPEVGFEREKLDGTLVMDNQANKELAHEIADAAWNDIEDFLEQFKELGAEKFNAIRKFARQQSSYIFSFKQDVKVKDTSGLSRALRANPEGVGVSQTPYNRGLLSRLGLVDDGPYSTEARDKDYLDSIYDELEEQGLISKGETPSVPAENKPTLSLGGDGSLNLSESTGSDNPLIQVPMRRKKQ